MKLEKKDIKICLLDGVHEQGIAVFKDAGFENIHLFPDSLPPEDLKKALADAHVVGIRSKTKLTREALEDASELLCIGRYGIGVNNVDLAAAEELGIPVFNGPFSSTRSVAELVIGAIFGLMRQIPQKSMEMHQGKWPKSASGCFEVRGKTLGLVGYGNIATQISVMAEAVGMNVIYSDVRTILPLGKAKQVTFDEVLKNSDVISLHVPGLPSTKNMINKDTLGKMKQGSYLINFARGSVVDIPALKDALSSGHLRGAALDVFPEEPKSKDQEFVSELRGAKNVILTPHIGGATEEAQAALGAEVSEKLKNMVLLGDSSTALNFPQIMPGSIHNTHRIVIVHKNQPGALAEINEAIAKKQANVSAQILKTKGAAGVVTIDVDKEVGDELAQELSSLSFTLKCRILS